MVSKCAVVHKDKLGQMLEVGLWVVRPVGWGSSGNALEVVKIEEIVSQGFKYAAKLRNGNQIISLCKIPERCIVVPEIVANYWEILG